jgi:hypothetical protein
VVRIIRLPGPMLVADGMAKVHFHPALEQVAGGASRALHPVELALVSIAGPVTQVRSLLLTDHFAPLVLLESINPGTVEHLAFHAPPVQPSRKRDSLFVLFVPRDAIPGGVTTLFAMVLVALVSFAPRVPQATHNFAARRALTA